MLVPNAESFLGGPDARKNSAFQNRKDLTLMPGAQGALMLRSQDSKDTWLVTKQEAQAMSLRVQGGPVAS